MKTSGYFFIITILFFSNTDPSSTVCAQTITNYPYCQCSESINFADNDQADGPYEVRCRNNVVERGYYHQGTKDGTWEVKNFKGTVVSRIKYTKGRLDGSYELFHFDGSPKLKAFFENDLPVGHWEYFNADGKIIKEGNYDHGKPVGIWTIYNKKGKKKLEEYDFDNKKYLLETSNSYFNSSAVISDEESGEYIILRYPPRTQPTKPMPLGDYSLMCDYFAFLFYIPTILMNTVEDYHYVATIKVERGHMTIEKLVYEEVAILRSEVPTIPYIVTTNPPKRQIKINLSDGYIIKLKERIGETLMVLGPWMEDKEIEMDMVILVDLNPVIY